MKLAFVVTQPEVAHLAQAARGWLVHVWGAQQEDVLEWEVCPPDPAQTQLRPRWVAAEFERLAGAMEREADARGGPAVLRDAVGIVDLYDASCEGLSPGQASVLGQRSPVVALASLLMLAFPEIHWIPLCPFSPSRTLVEEGPWPELLEKTTSRNAASFSALLDPLGLRERIREWVRSDPEGEAHCQHVPRREALAAAIDEEAAYTAFNGYVAYKFGYRSLLISTEWLFRKTLGNDPDRAWNSLKPYLTFEDLYLGFPDRSGGHLSNLEERDGTYKKLKEARHRVIVTVGHERGSGAGRLEQGRRYLRSQGQGHVVVYKPLPGLHRVWAEARPRCVAGTDPPHRNYRWPPRGVEALGEERSHSAPGRLFSVAEVLLARARKLLASSNPSIPDAIHTATLALEAKELLGGMTPTVALEAIALQQEAEVVAESLFLGVEYNLNLRKRFLEIRREVGAVSRWVHGSTRRRSELNARLTIIERLAKRFSDLHQIEEEMACLAEARRLRFEFWVREKPYRWIFWPVLRYVAFALSSLGKFALGVAAWVVFFAGIHYLLHTAPGAAAEASFPHALASSAYFFATLQPCGGIGHSTMIDAVLASQGFVAFLNLGLLISHLYLTVSRR
jgi:hypothetical protein